MNTAASSSQGQYDHALTYLFWSWGMATGFSDGTGENGGYYEHRAQTTDLLVDLIKKGNPWAPDPKTGRCAADLLWVSNCYPKDKFAQVIEACLAHPCAPDPSTWSTRPVFTSPSGDHKTPQLWINAIASHKQSPEMAQLYVDLGGRLDALDHNGNGLLANCGFRQWPEIEKFMAAAESKSSSIMGSKDGSWTSSWRHMSPTDLSQAQKSFAELAAKYPQAARSQSSPVEEMCGVIRQNSGMRPTSAAFKRLGLDKLVHKDPEVFETLFTEVLALGLIIFSHSDRIDTSTTFTYMSGVLAKASVKHPDYCHYHKVMAAGLASKAKYREHFQLISGGASVIPSASNDMASWMEGMGTLCRQIDQASKLGGNSNANSLGTFLNQICHLFHAASSATTAQQRHGFIEQMTKNIAFAPFEIVSYGDARSGHFIPVQDLLSCCDSQLPKDQKDLLACIGLEEIGYGVGGFLPAVSFAAQDLPAPSYYTTPYEAAKWLCGTLESYGSDIPKSVSEMLNHVHEKLMNKQRAGNVNVSGLEEVSSYLGRLRLTAKATGPSRQGSSRPQM